MEHREPPRIITGERRLDGALEGPDGLFPLRRFPFGGKQRQIHLGRAGLLTFVAVAVLIALVYFGFQAILSAIGWLHHQPQYQYSFYDIQLVPDPPVWFRGGRRAFLEGVRHDAKEGESIPRLDVLPERLADEFKHYAWVREVHNVFNRSGTVVVHLRYRQPVAYAQLPAGEQKLVDETGTILNDAEVDPAQLRRLVRIVGEGLAAPSDPKFGVVWKSRLKGSDQDEPERRILAAAKLAGFLREPAQMGDAERWPALRMIEINVSNYDPHGLFLLNAEDSAIWWTDAPGDEPPGRPTAGEKWAMLQRWRASDDHRPIPKTDFWAFDSDRVRQGPSREDRSRNIKKKEPVN